MASRRLVAPITTMFWRGSSPSIRVSSCATMRRSTSPRTSSRFGAIESISSMKMMAGALRCASRNLAQALLGFAVLGCP